MSRPSEQQGRILIPRGIQEYRPLPLNRMHSMSQSPSQSPPLQEPPLQARGAKPVNRRGQPLHRPVDVLNFILRPHHGARALARDSFGTQVE